MDVADPHTYKRLKEEFVSDLPGTTMLEIAALSAIFPAFVLLRQWGFSICNTGVGHVGGKNGEIQKVATRMPAWRSFLWTLALDFVIVVIPTLACLTILADKIYVFTTGVLCSLVITFFSVRKQPSFPRASLCKEHMVETSRKKSISSYRFIVMLVTCVSILAVDFTVYPRRYAKTETYGTGLMDVGVGSFVAANALVSRQARNLPPTKYGGVLRNTSPLLIMGFARLILTKGVDYQVHVGEYGVHWNFFFTLAAVALLTSLIRIPPRFCGILGLFILSVYQVFLLCGLNNYLNSSQRGASYVSLNKEGIFSLFGYWGLYLLGVQLGYYLFFESGKFLKKVIGGFDDRSYDQWSSAAEIWLLGAFFWVLVVFLDGFVERVSRRTCNLAYVVFVLAVNLEGLGIVLLSDFVPGVKQLLLEEVFEQNLLATFLLANVLTGLVNLSMDTIFAPAAVAYATLVMYLVILVGGMAILKASNFKIKFW